MKKKYVWIAFLLITIIAFLAGCAKNENTNKNNDAESKKKPEAEQMSGEIRVWSCGSTLKSLNIASKNFQNKYPDCKINIVEFKSAGEMYKKLEEGMRSGSDLPDVVTVDDSMVPYFSDKYPDKFLDVTNEVSSMKDQFLKSKISQCSFNNKIMAFPWSSSPAVIYYRRDIFMNAGVDADNIKTWDDYIDAGKKILKNTNGKVKTIAIAEKNSDIFYRELMNQLDTFYFDKDGKTNINSDKSYRIFNIMKKINDAGISFSFDNQDALIAEIKNGNIAAIPAEAIYSQTLMTDVPEQLGKWGMVNFPAFESGGNVASSLEGDNLMVIKNVKTSKLSLAFLKYASTDKETLMNSFIQYGVFPSYIPCYDDAVFNQGVSYFGGQEGWRMLAKTAMDVYEINYTKDYTETKKSFINTESDILFKNADIKSSVDALQHTVESARKK